MYSSTAARGASPAAAFLDGGGEMGALLRAHDWAHSSLGPPEAWSQALRTSVRLMLNTGHPMYIFWGADGACLYNDAYRASIGPERHPVSIGRPAFEVWEEIWEVIGPQIDQVMRGGGATWHVDQLIPITRYGKRDDVYWTYSYSPIDDTLAPNGVGGVLVICSETTQNVLTAARLVSERDRLAQLFEQAPTFMAVLRGAEHRIEIANPGYLQLVGNRDVVGRTVGEALPEAVEQGYLDLLDHVFSTGEVYVGNGLKIAFKHDPDLPDSDRYVDFVYQPIRADTGDVSGIFVQGVDVTDRTIAVNAIADSEARHRELAAELSDSNRLKDEFLATLAHELRNPLAPIRNALELMQMAPDDGAVGKTARAVMSRQIAHIVRMIDDLLDISRVSRGLVELRRSRMSLVTVVRDALETSRQAIENNGHDLQVMLPDEHLLLDVDPTRMVQVFANLLNNASKFTPRGGRIEFEVARDGSHVVVAVRDNGVGIPEAMQGHIFDLFTQVNRSHTQTGGGLGIGLTLVRRLVEMHGGTVSVHSEGAGRGSVFVVRLPLADTDSAAGVPQDASHLGAPIRRGRRVMVVDDNVDGAETLAMMLKLQGHDTVTVHDGAEALDLARTTEPEVMVLDIAMPGLDGHDLARAVRAEAWGKDVLLIAASGWGLAEHKEQSRAAGFDHHLVKPIDLDVLGDLIGGRN